MDLAGSLFLSLFCHYSKHFYATQPEQLGVISSALKQVDSIEKVINVCIRDDCEGLYEGAKDFIKRNIPDGYIFKEIDTVVPYRVKVENRSSELKNSWKSFASAALTITDRLHAMLFSYINGTPCVAFDNKTGKVFGVAQWVKDSGMIECVPMLENLQDCINNMINKPHLEYNPDCLRNHYRDLANLIRKGM